MLVPAPVADFPPDYDPSAAPPGDAGIFGSPLSPEAAGLVIVPVPWDATTSFGGGTADAPAALVGESHQLDLFDIETGEPWRIGIAMEPVSSEWLAANEVARALALEIRAGASDNRSGVDAASEAINAFVRGRVEHWLAAGKYVGVFGGDHSVAYGSLQAHAGRSEFGILQIDAHADLRVSYEGFAHSHASIMHNVLADIPQVTRLVQVGVRDLAREEHAAIDASSRIETYFGPKLDAELHRGRAWTELCQEMVEHLPQEVYVSFDIDGLQPSLCPNTGTPVPGGLDLAQAFTLLRVLTESGRRIIGFDLVEVGPKAWDLNVAARVLYKLCGWMTGQGPPQTR